MSETRALSMCGGSCTTYQECNDKGKWATVLNINHGPRMEEIRRESLGVRWCFACRGRRGFFFVVTDSVEPSYYGPNPSVRCGNCDQADGDCGFGRYREWDS